MFVLACALTFAAAFAGDYADTRHKIAVEQRDGHAAGVWSVLMYLVGIGCTWAIIDHARALIVPTVIGLYVGSRVAMWRACRTPVVNGKVAQSRSCATTSIDGV